MVPVRGHRARCSTACRRSARRRSRPARTCSRSRPTAKAAREPPPDGDAGRVRPLDRRAVRRAPSCGCAPRRRSSTIARAMRGLRYQPSPPSALDARHADLLDRVLDAASARGLAVYLQVMAASPPGYRVQFSGAARGGPVPRPRRHAACRARRSQRFARQRRRRCLRGSARGGARRHVIRGVAGFRLDWPEYPPYDLDAARCSISIRRCDALLAAAGHDPARRRAPASLAWLEACGRGARAAAPRRRAGCRARARRARAGPRSSPMPARSRALFAAKRSAARALAASRCARRSTRCRGRGGGSSRRRFRRRSTAISGFPLGRPRRRRGPRRHQALHDALADARALLGARSASATARRARARCGDCGDRVAVRVHRRPRRGRRDAALS